MSWVRIWVHLVFTTYKNAPFFNSPEIRNQVFNHIRENAQIKNIWLDSVGGHKQHIHCLISLGKDQTMSGIMQLIKGESSFWINKNKIVQENLRGKMIIGQSVLVKVILNRSGNIFRIRRNIIGRNHLRRKLMNLCRNMSGSL
jgi:REP element-mobilizing transposase RayT